MKKISRGWWLLALAVACSSNEGGGKRVGGGQSGTDSQGAYTCVLDSPVVEDIPLGAAAAGIQCSAEQEFEQLEGSQTFDCVDHHVSFTVNVLRGSGARRLTGDLFSDTDATAPPTDCYAMSLDASVAIHANDASVELEGPVTLTVDHLCNSAKIDGKVPGTGGEFQFEFWQEDLFVTFPNRENEHCMRAAVASTHSTASDAGGL